MNLSHLRARVRNPDRYLAELTHSRAPAREAGLAPESFAAERPRSGHQQTGFRPASPTSFPYHSPGPPERPGIHSGLRRVSQCLIHAEAAESPVFTPLSAMQLFPPGAQIAATLSCA